MDISVVILLVILIFIIISLFASSQCKSYTKTNEGFDNSFGYYKTYCADCGTRTRSACSKCTNCGFCLTSSGIGSCSPGNDSGPSYRTDCQYWEYGDPYFYYQNSNVYPIVKIRNTYPHYINGIKKPWNNKKTQY